MGLRLKNNLTAEFWNFRIRFPPFLDAFAVSRVGFIKYLLIVYNNQIGELYLSNSDIVRSIQAYQPTPSTLVGMSNTVCKS